MNRFSIGKGTLMVLLLLVVGSASAQIKKQGNGYLLRTKYTKGEVITYVTDTKTNAQGRDMLISMTMTQKVLSVSRTGAATVSMTMGKVLLNGKPMGQQVPEKMQKVTFETDSQGHVKGGGQQNTNVIMPDKPIPVGGTWSATTNAPIGTGQSMQVTVTYKLLGFEKKGKYQTAKISVKMSGSGQMAISGTGTMWLNMADGSMVEYVNKASMTFGSMQMPMDMTVIRK
ncbi:MAG TPA: hypothetical protein VHE55_14530 [Fimbriimonadaceae bacterium]|nr:hypothetical protein [Fimbriimonadaceae bacterium]